MLRTVVPSNKALGSKLLRGRFRTMREKQDVPIAVSHVEDVRVEVEAPKLAGETKEKKCSTMLQTKAKD